MLAPATAYPGDEPVPPGSVLFHGDLHAGKGVNAAAHMAVARTDLLRLGVPVLVQVGDMTQNGGTEEDAEAVAHLTGLAAGAVRKVVGNHDMHTDRTGLACMNAWGEPDLNWTLDHPEAPVTIIGVSPDGPVTPIPEPTVLLSQDTLDWLDAELESATQECWIVCHAPLSSPLTGAGDDWDVQPEATIPGLLDARPAATAWFSGHVHQAFDYPNMVVLKNLGTRSIIQANASAIAYVNPGDEADDPVMSLMATYVEGGADLRVRDHTRRFWWMWPEGVVARRLLAT